MRHVVYFIASPSLSGAEEADADASITNEIAVSQLLVVG